jgi:hypothetical protein
LNFSLKPLSVLTTVEVTTAAPLLDTESAALGTDVTNEYVRDIPLYNRSFYGLVFLAAGVTETTGSGINDNYPSGTNFVSNGQRKCDVADHAGMAAPLSAASAGRGCGHSTCVTTLPSVEIVAGVQGSEQQLRGGIRQQWGDRRKHCSETGHQSVSRQRMVVRTAFEFRCRDFFNTGEKPDHVRDQYGFAVGGPIIKNRTFFFVDFEKTRIQRSSHIEGIVPTDLERAGDFSQSPRICPTRRIQTPTPRVFTIRAPAILTRALSVHATNFRMVEFLTRFLPTKLIRLDRPS